MHPAGQPVDEVLVLAVVVVVGELLGEDEAEDDDDAEETGMALADGLLLGQPVQ